MNQQSKKLLFNKSTLLSLKAELLKKQEEVKGKKQLPQNRVENFKPPPVVRNTTSADKRETFKDKLEKEVDTDEIEAQKRSKLALEKKAELYEHLSDGIGASQLAGRFLVDFHTKGEEERRHKREEERTKEDADETKDEESQKEFDDDDDDDDWVDFTDCLGRTRRCLKTDLELYTKRDREMMRTLRIDGSEISNKVDVTNKALDDPSVDDEEQIGPQPEKTQLVQETDAYLQSLREKWEKKEREMVERDTDIHYQDLLFDEARAHGVGYYGFSTEETARRREQAELARAREDTRRAQAEAAERRAHRDELVQRRVAAARARQRQRAGLPPEAPEDTEEFKLSSILDFLTEQKEEAAKKAKEEEDKLREEREKERQKLRENYVREWDVGKEGEGVGGKKKEFREMTQEEYVDQQRSKRIDEFAPPKTKKSRVDDVFDDSGNFIASHIPPPTIKTWGDVRQNVSQEVELPSSSKGLYFSSKDERKYANFVASSEPVPIVNELDEPVETERKISRRNNVGAEIEPPPTYDYYGPEVKKARTEKGPDLRESYEQGLKYLQEIESKKCPVKNMEFTS